MRSRIARHWPEYSMEAAELALFMIAACLVVALLEHPDSAVAGLVPDAGLRRALTGLAMGATAIALIYSPFGQRSGAHFNPAVTLTYLRLGKIEGGDALGYILAQLVGGTLGVLAAAWILGERIAHPAVSWVATRPGELGTAAAFAAELAISCAMMSLVLAVSSHARLARFTGLFAGAAVALFITFEAPLSGMSMNPARSFGPALVGGIWQGFWVYLAAPVIGMLVAAELRRRLAAAPPCAKLVHPTTRRCIFCGHEPPLDPRRGFSRHAAFVPIALLLAAELLAAPGARATEPETAVHRVGPIGVTVGDADAAAAFYADVLSFEKVSDVEVWGEQVDRLSGIFASRLRVVRMRLGEETIELTEYMTPRGRAVPGDSHSNDRWFQHVAIITPDMDRAYAHLRAHRVRHASPAPQTLPAWNPAAGGIRAFYFQDPDGHPLEILEFPAGKGDARWHRPTDRLFLGIDHTAIVVGDTDTSLEFYRDVLGLRIAGESENFGPEQAALNAVFGAHLRITTLRAPAGPGIELLEYLSPRDGRPIPADQRPNDLAYWQTTLETSALPAALERLRGSRRGGVSPAIADLSGTPLGDPQAALARDPDGHALRLVPGGAPAPR